MLLQLSHENALSERGVTKRTGAISSEQKTRTPPGPGVIFSFGSDTPEGYYLEEREREGNQA